jgi:hypothetical protein
LGESTDENFPEFIGPRLSISRKSFGEMVFGTGVRLFALFRVFEKWDELRIKIHLGSKNREVSPI